MNIYIYGNNGFKKEIHQTLEHSNIKFKLDEDSIIKDIASLEELKQAIQANPNDIYLIDDEKIIKKSGLSKKIKFLNPKDGIEEEFLLDNGIADLSVDSLSEIPKYILQKHEQQQSSDIHESIVDIVDDAYNENSDEDDYFDEPIELDDELAQLLAGGEETPALEDIQEKNENFEEKKDDDIDDFDFDELVLDEELPAFEENDDLLDEENNVSLEQDINLDDLDNLMESNEFDMNSDDGISEEELNSMMNFDEDVGLNNVSLDYDDKDIVEENDEELSSVEKVLENDDIMEELDSMDSFSGLEELDDLDKLLEDTSDDDLSELDSLEELDMEEAIKNIEIDTKESNKGESMADEFSELDSLNEADIMSALNGLDDITPAKTSTKPSTNSVNTVSTQKENIEVSSSNSQDIADLISKLLNNKTLEITIKIKD